MPYFLKCSLCVTGRSVSPGVTSVPSWLRLGMAERGQRRERRKPWPLVSGSSGLAKTRYWRLPNNQPPDHWVGATIAFTKNSLRCTSSVWMWRGAERVHTCKNAATTGTAVCHDAGWRWQMGRKQANWHEPVIRYVWLRVGHAPGMTGTFPRRVSDPDMHHGTCVTHVPWCMPVSLTSGFLGSRWRGKRSRHT